MLINYLKIALRNMMRHKAYSFINIMGLAIGIACFMLIVLFVRDELSYDRFHSKAGRIYRVAQIIDTEGQGENSSSNPFPVGPSLRNDYPQLIQEAVRFFNFQVPTFTIQYEARRFNESKLFFADSSVFRVFDFPLAEGDAAKALVAPNTIVLSRELAQKYFGTVNPVGKRLRFESVIDLTVTGVFDELPQQSHIHFNALMSFSTLKSMMGPGMARGWVWNPCWTYVLLKKGVQAAELEAQFPSFVRKYYPEFIKPQVKHYLQPLTTIHLHSNLDYEMEPNGNEADVYIFSVIGLFVLGIACINFMNLATARSAGRAREVGMRKVLGAERSQLIRQFLGESLLLSFFAVLVAIAIIELSLPLFNSLSGKELSLQIISGPWVLLQLFSIGIITGLAAGIYPAFFLASFQPIKVLKGNTGLGNRNIFLRKGLVILQFVISLALIMSTIVIYRQLNFLRTVDLGFDKEQIIVMPVRPPMIPKLEAMKNELLRNRNITSVTTMNEIIGAHHNTHEFNYEGMQPGKWIYFPALMIGDQFTETFRIDIIAGRSFSKDIKSDDSLGVLINESMVKHLNWGSPGNALGRQFYTPNGKERVIGVMKDFNFVSLEQPIGPFVLDIPPRRESGFWLKYVALRIAPLNVRNTIGYIEKQWNTFAPAYPFEYSFLNSDIEKLYKSQDNLAKLVANFSILAILIACLGLFTLASFTVQQRTKEIGIRKVLGASVTDILLLISKDFLRLVFFAILIASPIVWFGMNRWLQNFAYRIEISTWVFVIAGAAGLLIALLTISFQALRASLSDPVKSLRYE